MHKFLLNALSVCALVAACAGTASAGETLDRVTSRKVLVMTTDASYPPYSFLNDKNEMDGFDVAIGREIAKRLGAELKTVTPEWEVVTAGRWNGRWDISVGSMAPTAERGRVLDFPAVYYFAPASLAVHRDNPARTPAELSGKRIATSAGATTEQYLRHELKLPELGTSPFSYQVENPQIRPYETDTSAFDDLRLGDGKRLDAVFSPTLVLRQAIKSGYPFRLVGEPLFYEPLAVAVDKGDPEFSAKIAATVEAMRADGTLKRLSEQWLGDDYTQASAR